MASGSFTLQRIHDFGLRLDSVQNLFPDVAPRGVPPRLRAELVAAAPLAVSSFGRSHYLVGPILAEIWRQSERRIALYAGMPIPTADEGGFATPDFVIADPTQLPILNRPVRMAVTVWHEASAPALDRCAESLRAARRLNANFGRMGDALTGVVTEGQVWRFLQLRDNVLTVETTNRYVSDLDAIFGILWHCAGLPPEPAPGRA